MHNNKGKKKIGLLIPHLASGGAGRAVSRISVLLAQSYDVYLILFTSKQIDFDYSGTIIDLDLASKKQSLIRKLWQTGKRITALKKIKKRYKLDVVISFLDIANICNILTKTKSCKVITSVRGSVFNYKANGITEALKKWILARIYKGSDRIIAVSKVIKSDLVRQFSLSENKVVSIYNPFDKDSILDQANEDIDAETAEFIKGRKVVLAVGQLVFAKGFWHLIKAFKQVNRSLPDAVLLICGDGSQKENIKRLICDLSLASSVRLLGFQKNIFPYMKASDIFVLSSVTEGFPNVLVEAMICGRPVVAADCVSGPREILVEEPDLTEEELDIKLADFGILTPRMTPEENWDALHNDDCERYLAMAMETLLKDVTLQAHYNNMAKNRSTVFDNEICKEAYEQIIDEAVESR